MGTGIFFFVYFYVDVIGYFYSPSDSRFKKNIQPLNNTLSGLLRLSGISYQLNKETPAGTWKTESFTAI